MENTESNKMDSSSNVENTAEVIFGETKHTIKRLKAGKFYGALKVYMDMIKEVAPKTSNLEKDGVPKKEATVDFEILVVSIFQSWPEKMIKFINICCSSIKDSQITEEKIKEDAYPEQITEAFRTCMKLNKVAENLKNFVAPIGELGAEIQPKAK